MKFCYLFALISVIGMSLTNVKEVDAQAAAAVTDVSADSGIRFFEGAWEQALAEARKTGKPIFMDCYTAWCGPCKMLAKDVFTKPEVGEYFNAHFINMKRDMENGEGKTLKEIYKPDGYPTLYFIDGQGEAIHRIVGAPDAKVLLENAALAVANRGYAALDREYAGGNRQPQFIEEYLKLLDVAGKGVQASQVCLDYFNRLDKELLKEKTYWDLFQKYVKQQDNKAVEYVYKHRNEFYEVIGEKEVRKKLYGLYAGGAARFSSGNGEDAVWDAKGFERYTKQLMKMDIDNKDVILSDARMSHALKVKDWPVYVRLATVRVQENKVGDLLLYNWGKRVNQACEDMALREQAALWMDEGVKKSKPAASGMMDFKSYFEKVGKELRQPMKSREERAIQATASNKITIRGNVAALCDKGNVIEVIKKEGFFKQTVDSCEINADGSYELQMTVERPGEYTLRCQKGQSVSFWAGDEDIKVNFPGFGKAKIKVIRPIYLPIEGGKNNEVMNTFNWIIYQNKQLSGAVSRPVYQIAGLADSIRQKLSSELANATIKDVLQQIGHWAEIYADREAVVVLLQELRAEENAELVRRILAGLSEKYPASIPVKEFQAALEQRAQMNVGVVAPEFSLPTAEGNKKMGPQDFRGKILVLDFWASWCGPCRAEIPHLKEAFKAYNGKGVEFLSISIDKDGAAWRKAMQEENMPWAQVQAPQAGKEVMKQYQFSGIPFIVVVDKEGRIAGKNLRDKALMDKLEELTR